MATGMEWLQKQKKSDLSEVASQVGLKSYDKLKRMDLEVALEEHLRTNYTALRNNSTAAPFYQGVDPASPVKHRGGRAVSGGIPADEKEKKQPRARRQTIKATGGDESETITATPSRVSALASRVPLPPSPAVLATKIESSTASLRANLSNSLSFPRTKKLALNSRSYLSTATALTNLFLALEFFSLLYVLLPLKPAFATPSIPLLHLPSIPVSLPDLFALLTAAFWGPVTLWSVVGVAVPAGAGWLVNFQGPRRARVDVVGFNVARAVVAWLVFLRGGVEGRSVSVVRTAIPAGVTGTLVGAAVGVLGGVYEAVLKK